MSWDKEITRLDSLAAALTVLRQIPMKNMRHGKDVFTANCYSEILNIPSIEI